MTLKAVSAVVGLAGTLGAGIWAIDAHYAKAAHVEAEFASVAQRLTAADLWRLQTEQRALEAEAFQLRVTAERRALTALERQRLAQVTVQLQQLAVEIARVRRGLGR
jgi:hypothetical protein